MNNEFLSIPIITYNDFYQKYVEYVKKDLTDHINPESFFARHGIPAFMKTHEVDKNNFIDRLNAILNRTFIDGVYPSLFAISHPSWRGYCLICSDEKYLMCYMESKK